MTTPATQQQPQSPFTPFNAALAAAYLAALARVRAKVFAFLTDAFHHSGQWRDEDLRRFVRTVVPVVQAGQRSVSTLTSAYLNRLVSEMAAAPVPLATVTPSEITGSAVRKADPDVGGQRPGDVVWTELAAGTPLEVAVERGQRRAVDLAATDLQLAKTHTAKKVLTRQPKVVGYRRVPQGPYTCALCLIVSTRRYHKEELAAVHPNCDCGIEPIHGDFDPGPVLDEDFLDAVHAAIVRDLGEDYAAPGGRAKDTRARELDYRDIIIVHEHGEIGPVLGVRGQSFTGKADVRRFTSHQKITV